MQFNIEDYKVDHLFLLVGKNPLPNYVVAKSRLILREGGTHYLVYTKDTQNYAYKLRDKLHLTSQEMLSLDCHQSDAFFIQTRIKNKARTLSGKLGLNYTGGTKSMAVNAYIAIKTIDESSIFSYLDPKELKLLVDQPDRSPIPLKIDLDIKFEDLFDLHLLKLTRSPVQQPIFPELIRILSENTHEWRFWCDDVLHTRAKRAKSSGKIGWQSKGKLRHLLLPLGKLPLPIIDSFKDLDFIDDQAFLSIEKMLSSGLFSKPEDVCKWLDGIWLEHYLLSEIQKEFSQASLSFDVSNINFEFDVAFIEGYQLFAFSCTSSDDKSLCKAKLFEAYIRGKQLGGDEARIALVCCSDNPEILEQDITGMIPDSKVKVFGRKHLQSISDEVTQWVKEQSSHD